VGAGPGIFHEFSKDGLATLDGERTTVFGRIVVGGWWGGESEPSGVAAPESPSAPAPTTRPMPHFGDRDTWAFSGDLSAAVRHSTYSGSTNRSFSNYSIAPAFDYFFADHVSIGLAAGVGHESDETHGDRGETLTSKSTSVFGGVRLGVDVPISTSVSFYPKAYVSARHSSFDVTSTGNAPLSVTTNTVELSYASNDVTLALYAPILLHFASHAFAGFGPSVARSVVNHREGSTGEDNLGTTIGAHLVVGGWLSR
jgi:hypothetical protein